MLDTANYTPRLKTLYRETIKPAMKEEFGYANDMMIPRLEKIVLNIGCGAESVRDSKKAKSAVEDLTAIAGQQAVIDHGEEVHRGLPCARGHAAGVQGHAARRPDVRLPRPPDHHRHAPHPRLPRCEGKSFDGRGNFAMGIKEHIVFPEINFDKVDRFGAWTSSW
jgi:large subunit ribosomal protein L5